MKKWQNYETDQHNHRNGKEYRARPLNGPRQHSLVGRLESYNQWGGTKSDGFIPQENQAQRGRDSQSNQHRS